MLQKLQKKCRLVYELTKRLLYNTKTDQIHFTWSLPRIPKVKKSSYRDFLESKRRSISVTRCCDRKTLQWSLMKKPKIGCLCGSECQNFVHLEIPKTRSLGTHLRQKNEGFRRSISLKMLSINVFTKQSYSEGIAFILLPIV